MPARADHVNLEGEKEWVISELESFTEEELRAWLEGDPPDSGESNEGDFGTDQINALVDRENDRAAKWQHDVEHKVPPWFRNEHLTTAETAGYSVRYIPEIRLNKAAMPSLRAPLGSEQTDAGWHLVRQDPLGERDLEELLHDFFKTRPALAKRLIELQQQESGARLVADYFYATTQLQSLFPELAHSPVRPPTLVEQWYLADTEEERPLSGEFLCVGSDGIVPLVAVVYREEELSAYRLYGMADHFEGHVYPIRKLV